jgi:NTE family protein
MRSLAIILLLVASSGLTATCLAKDPRIGLVLSGGGARGLAHIGVLRALEEQNIQIHAIAGTSMGAIIGGLYATGRTPDELEQIAKNMDWGEAFADTPPRNRLSYRQKVDSRKYLVKTQASLDRGVLSLPKGVVQGQNLHIMLQEQFKHVVDVSHFDELPIPFRAIASDLVSGDAHVFEAGSLATALRASMSIPGLFTPVEMDGKMLVDGGIANNLPVDVVKQMGVDYVIAVDITTPLYTAEELDSVIPIVEQLTTLLTFNQQKKQYALLDDDDILITPNLSDLNTASFDGIDLAIARGYQSIKRQYQHLAKYTSSTMPRRRVEDKSSLPVITRISTNNSSEISDKLILAQVTQKLGEPLDEQGLKRDLERIYGYQYFNAVQYEINGNELSIITTPKAWGRDLLGLNFELTTDWDGPSSYNLGVGFKKSDITRKGGELFSLAQIGQDQAFETSLYLPLDYKQYFFGQPYFAYTEETFNTVTNSFIQSQFRIDNISYGALMGVAYANTAIYGIGYEYNEGDIESLVGDTVSVDSYEGDAVYFLTEFDTLNNLYFPHQGSLASLRYDVIQPGDNSEDFNRLDVSITTARPIGPHSLVFEGRLIRNFGTPSSRYFKPSLGGLKQLSGFEEDALVGNQMVYLAATYFHRLDQQSILPVDLPVYVGLSLEAGNVWQDSSDMRLRNLIYTGAVMLGVDTPLGPLYLGYGRTEEDEASLYLRLGRLF